MPDAEKMIKKKFLFILNSYPVRKSECDSLKAKLM